MKQTLKLTLVMVLGVFLTFCQKAPDKFDCTIVECIDAGGGNEVPIDSDFGDFIDGKTLAKPGSKTEITIWSTDRHVSDNSCGIFNFQETSILGNETEKWEKGWNITIQSQKCVSWFFGDASFLDESGKSFNYTRQYFDQKGAAITIIKDINTTGLDQTSFINNTDNQSNPTELTRDISTIDKIFEAIIFEAQGKKFYTTGPPIYITHAQ